MSSVSEAAPNKAAEQRATHGMPEILMIPTELIRVGEFCSRQVKEDKVNDLAKSIDLQGLINPPVVVAAENGKYRLAVGWHRYLAYRQLGWQEIPCRVMSLTPRQEASLSFAENYFTDKPDPVEQAKSLFKEKQRFKLTDTELAETYGLAQSLVTERLSILRLPEDIVASTDARPDAPFRYSHALELAKMTQRERPNRDEELRALYRKTVEHKLTAVALRRHVHLFTEGHYDQLPQSLQALLLTSRWMTWEMAMLYLNPSTILEGEGKQVDQLREDARNWPLEDRERFVQRAIRNGWTYERAKGNLVKALEQLAAQKNKSAKAKPIAEKLFESLSRCVDDVQAAQSQVSSLHSASEIMLRDLRKASALLQGRLLVLQRILDEPIRTRQGGDAHQNRKETANVAAG